MWVGGRYLASFHYWVPCYLYHFGVSTGRLKIDVNQRSASNMSHLEFNQLGSMWGEDCKEEARCKRSSFAVGGGKFVNCLRKSSYRGQMEKFQIKEIRPLIICS